MTTGVRVPFKDPAIAKAGSTDQSSMIWRRFVQADSQQGHQAL